MKKTLLILIAILCFNLSQAQTTVKYTEFNIGASVGIVPIFPGFSILYGATTKYDSGLLLDYQGGLAFPSLLTAKGGVGFYINPKLDITAGIRIWPTSTYLQLRSNISEIKDIVFTIEALPGGSFSLGQSAIFSVGWRRNISTK